MRYLGIDYGKKKVGLATADSELKMAIPQPAIYYSKESELISKIKKIIEEESIGLVVVGLPLSLNFQETTISQEVREFIQKLKNILSISIVFENELLSSKQAAANHDYFFNQNKGRSPKKAEKIDLDSQAAAIILDSYLVKQTVVDK